MNNVIFSNLDKIPDSIQDEYSNEQILVLAIVDQSVKTYLKLFKRMYIKVATLSEDEMEDFNSAQEYLFTEEGLFEEHCVRLAVDSDYIRAKLIKLRDNMYTKV